jgi:L-asparagine oxygenase
MNFYKENDYILELTDNEIKLLLNLAQQIIVSPSQNPEIFCKQSQILSNELPTNIKNKLTDFAINGTPTGFLLIKTIPIDNETLHDTPCSNNDKIGETTILARIQSILIGAIAELVSYEAEGYGRLFQDIIPMKSMSNKQTSVSSNVELEIHTEQAFSKLRPDILSLACLRGDVRAFTHILPIQTIIDNVSNEDLQLLNQPLWNCGVDLSFKINGNEFIDGDIRGPFSIITPSVKNNETNSLFFTDKSPTKRNYEDDLRPKFLSCRCNQKNTQNENNGEIHKDNTLLFDQDLMTGITEKADNMIKKIVDIYYKKRLSHNLKQGEIILVDNRRAVHGRSPFIPSYDGKDRFLIRCFATFDFEKSKYARTNNNRNILAIYS